MRTKAEQSPILWKDRKRILGLPLSFTRYEVSEGRLITRKGLFRTETDELLIFRILDIKLTRGFGDKLVGVGNVTLYSADQTDNSCELKRIQKPDDVRRMLSKLVETERKERGVTSRELRDIVSGGDGRGDGLDGESILG
jgi:uncharacterized membrane protein YdbT with pleckstrin-like domain